MRTCFLRTSPSPTRSTSKRTRAVLIVTKSKKVAPLPKTVISFNEFKEKGNKLYNKGQYSKALEQYVEAYSLLKWIEVRDRTLLSYANIVQKQRAIVDGDIIKRSSYLNSTDDDDTFNDCICSILLSISYCFLQMRFAAPVQRAGGKHKGVDRAEATGGDGADKGIYSRWVFDIQ